MPINASIPLSGQLPQAPDPLRSVGRAIQMRDLLDNRRRRQIEDEDAQLALDQRRKVVADADAINAAYAQWYQDGPGDRTKLAQLLSARGQGSRVPGILKALDDADKASNDAREAKLKADEAEADYFGGLALQVKNSGYDPNVLHLGLMHAAGKGYNVAPMVDALRRGAQADAAGDARAAAVGALGGITGMVGVPAVAAFTDQASRARIKQITDAVLAASKTYSALDRAAAKEAREAQEFNVTLPGKTPNAAGLTPEQEQQATDRAAARKNTEANTALRAREVAVSERRESREGGGSVPEATRREAEVWKQNQYATLERQYRAPIVNPVTGEQRQMTAAELQDGKLRIENGYRALLKLPPAASLEEAYGRQAAAPAAPRTPFPASPTAADAARAQQLMAEISRLQGAGQDYSRQLAELKAIRARM